MKKYVLAACLALLLSVSVIACDGTDDTPAPTDTKPAVTDTDVSPEISDTGATTGSDTDAVTDPVVETEADESETETESESESETESREPPEEERPTYLDLEFCHYNYECVKSVNEVVADGLYHENEWSEAYELVINNDTLEDWGRWQAGPALEASELSVTFKLKWDEEYLYLLELRTDAHYVYEFRNKGYDVFSDVWGGDATAFFLCDATYSMREDRCDIGYFSYVDKLQGPAVYVGSFDGETNAFRGPSGKDDCTYGGSFDGETAVFEMKLPWSIIENQGKLFTEIEEGALFRFNPIIPSVDSTEGLGAYGDEWRQINFHDCYDNGEGGNPDDPYYWAALTLVGPRTDS